MSAPISTADVERLVAALFGPRYGSDEPMVVDPECTREYDWGWTIALAPKSFVEARDPMEMMIGHGPIFVTRDARFFLTGSGVDYDGACRALAILAGGESSLLERLRTRKVKHDLLSGECDVKGLAEALPEGWAKETLAAWVRATTR